MGNSAYYNQIAEALYCGGSKEAQHEASGGEWAMHLVTLPWKLFFGLIPPVEYGGGWVRNK